MKKIVFILIFLFAGSANAGSLNGDIIFNNSSFLSPPSAVVSADIEFSGSFFGSDSWDALFYEDRVSLVVETSTNIGLVSPITWSFTDLDFDDGSYIIDVLLTNFVGDSFIDPAGISFTNHSFSYTMNYLSLDASMGNPVTYGSFLFITAPGPEPGPEPVPEPVPEPISFILFTLGLAGISFSRKKRNS